MQQRHYKSSVTHTQLRLVQSRPVVFKRCLQQQSSYLSRERSVPCIDVLANAGSAFQGRAAATGNPGSPSVVRRVDVLYDAFGMYSTV